MLTIHVEDMTCGHCVRTITRAVQAVDGQAVVTADLESRQVRLQPGTAGPALILKAIREAGYSAELLPAAAPSASAATRQGCCQGMRCGA